MRWARILLLAIGGLLSCQSTVPGWGMAGQPDASQVADEVDSGPALEPDAGIDATVSLEEAALAVTGLQVQSGKAYEQIPSLAMGATQYIDRDFTLTTVPSSVAGSLAIRTANDDKDVQSASHLTFTVNKPVTIYVAHDDRISPRPSWLTDNYQSTGEKLENTDGSAPEHTLFKREVQAGTVVLGGNVTADSNKSMYTVIVVDNL